MAWVALILLAVAGMVNGLASTDTITWGGDNSRTGYQTSHNMDPAVVGSSQFDQLFRTALPGNYNGFKEVIYSQPLVYTPSGGEDQFVYFATTQNNVYKLDAKTGEIVASRNLAIPFLTDDLDGCVDINPTVGIIGTGVIDPSTDTLYLVAKTYVDQDGGNEAQGKPNGRNYVHALDVNDLSERDNFPIDLEGIVGRNNPTRMFNGGIQLQRPGLLHYGQYIYAGFGSHCVQYNFTGWVIGWDKTSGEIVEHFVTEGDGVPNTVKGASLWMSGGGIASDDAGSMFFATGNGYASQLATIPVSGFNPPTSLEEAAVHMSIGDDGKLDVVDFFMPYEKQALDGADKDLGTGPLEILPSEFSCGNVRRIGVVTGKSGKTYWIDLDRMGGYRNGANGLDDVIQVYQNENSVYAGAGVYPLEGGYIYINVIQYPSHVFKFSCNNGKPSFTKVADTPNKNAYILGVSHGTVTSLNGEPGTGLFWVTDVQGDNLRIYDAVPKDGTLNLIKSFKVPGTTKFTRPVFGDGILYMGTNQGYVYGFGAPTKAPLNCTGGAVFGQVEVQDESTPKTVQCRALVGVTISGIGLGDGRDFSLSNPPILPTELTAGQEIIFQVQFTPTDVGLISDRIIVNTTNAAAGYATSTAVRLLGTGESEGALLAVSPKEISFQGVVAGDDPSDLTQNVILTNRGSGELTVQQVLYSTQSDDGPFEVSAGNDTISVGKFTVSNVPDSIDGGSSVTLVTTFDSSADGNYTGYVKLVTSGGNGTFTITGSAGQAPAALLEFQTPDASDWVTYEPGVPFTFGNVTQNTQRSLKFRVTNAAPPGGVSLYLTVSKPPFGVGGIVRAVNQVDLAEGTRLDPGESSTAVLTCAVPKSQWNVDAYNGTSVWTMNTNDPSFEKQIISFFCEAVSEQAAPLLRPGEGQYRYIGCFKENNPGRQLDSQLYGNASSTNAMCIEKCASGDWEFCGTEYHTECWGGNRIPSLMVDDKNCNFACGGDLNQICGGNGVGQNAGGSYISVFADSLRWEGNYTRPDSEGGGGNPGQPPKDPVVNPGVQGYVSLGCYTEAKTGRALPDAAQIDSATVSNCIEACSGKNQIYAGLEYASECWCGSKLGSGSVSAPAEDCSLACQGNSTELCGGHSRLNLYKVGGSSPPTGSNSTATTPVGNSTTPVTTSPTASPTDPAVRQTIGDWGFEGCYTETSDGRALWESIMADDDMTLEACADFCDEFTYFGVEYGRECYCGDSLRQGSVPAEDQDECSFLCPGDDTTFCGAGMRLQLYKRGGGGGGSITSSSSITSGSITRGSTPTSPITPAGNNTAKTASTASTPISEDDTVPPGVTPSPIYTTIVTSVIPSTSPSPSTTTTLAPPSTTTAIISTPSSTTTSSATLAPPSSSSSSSSSSIATLPPSSSTTPTATLTPSSTPTPIFSTPSSSSTPSATVAPPSSSSSIATLPPYSSSTPTATLTPSSSSSTTTTTTSPTPSSSKTPTDTLTPSITSASTTTTSTSTTTTTAVPTPTAWPGNANFTYFSCVSEPSAGRLLAEQVFNDGDDMTIEACLERCWEYRYAGVEYGRECWCGDVLDFKGEADATPGRTVADSECSFPCPGDERVSCGAGVRLSLYTLKDAVVDERRKAGDGWDYQ